MFQVLIWGHAAELHQGARVKIHGAKVKHHASLVVLTQRHGDEPSVRQPTLHHQPERNQKNPPRRRSHLSGSRLEEEGGSSLLSPDTLLLDPTRALVGFFFFPGWREKKK